MLQAKGLQLKAGTVVDATLIAAPSSTKNQSGERDHEMHQSKKGNQWYFGMKAHIGVDADSGLVHTVRGTSGNVGDVVEANSLLHGQETDAFGDAGYQGADKRPDANKNVRWHVAMRPGLRRALPVEALIDEYERTKASIRAKVEHPFRVLKQQFDYVKVSYRGAQEEHGAACDAVCALQSVDGQAQAFGRLGTGARAGCVMPQDRGRPAPGQCIRGLLHVRNCSTSAPF